MASACRLNGTEFGITGLEFLTGAHAGERYELSRYVRRDGSMQLGSDALKSLLLDYVSAKPEYKKAIILRRHPHKVGFFYITDREGTVNFGELTREQLKKHIEERNTLFDLISFEDIAKNTQAYEDGNNETAGVREDNLEARAGAWKMTPVRVAELVAASMLMLYASCNAIRSFSRTDSAFEPINYSQLDQRIKSTLINISAYRAFVESDDQESADYQLRSAKWFVDNIDVSSLSDAQKLELKKIESAIEEAKKWNH
jgi:hypothetical protein